MTIMIKVALDAMGGDNAPEEIVKGAVKAAEIHSDDFTVVLCGPEKVVQQELQKCGWNGKGIEIFDAPELVAMDESPSLALKTKPNSGLVSSVALQKKGEVQASVSAGNSGAMMAACLMILGRVGNISRPAIATMIPTVDRHVVLVDSGANVDEKAQTLVHFGLCGSVFAESFMGMQNPSVGLLNMGEEAKKGPEVIQEAYKLLKEAPLNFHGNIEGYDVVLGTTDVIVAPGYTGNVVLKLIEGFYSLHKKLFGTIDTDAGRKFDLGWDYRNHGGALLLGLNGTGLITHGRADSQAIARSLEVAYDFALNGVSAKIAEKLG
jgi:phosphate acyltransferase